MGSVVNGNDRRGEIINKPDDQPIENQRNQIERSGQSLKILPDDIKRSKVHVVVIREEKMGETFLEKLIARKLTKCDKRFINFEVQQTPNRINTKQIMLRQIIIKLLKPKDKISWKQLEIDDTLI